MGIVPRAMIANERGAVGVVVGVRDDGSFTVVLRRGQWGEGRIGGAIEILAAPDEWHAGRLVILQEWRARPPDWPHHMVAAGRMLGMSVLDHVIVTRTGAVSLAELDLLEPPIG